MGLGRNLNQVYGANPSSTLNGDDLLYAAKSPYGSANDSGIKYSDLFAQLAGSFVQTSGAVISGDIPIYGADGQTVKDSGVGIDPSKNIYPNNSIAGYSTTVTAGSTTTLTVASPQNQFFTGTTTQILVLPVTSTLTLGFKFYIVNNSSSSITVESSGGNTIQVMTANSSLLVTCILTSGTTAASWNADYKLLVPAVENWHVVSGTTQAITTNNSYFSNNSGLVTFTLPVTSSVGDIIQVAGMGAGGWKIIENAGQYIQIGQTQSAVALGYIASTNQYDSIKLVCNIANTAWTTPVAPQGNITIFDAPGLIFWSDANDPSGNGTQPTTGTSIGSWADKSGISGPLTQAIVYAPAQPVFRTSIQNSLPGMQFDPTIYETFLTVASMTLGSNFTIFAVSRSADNSLFMEQSADATANNGFNINGVGNPPATVRNGGSSVTGPTTSDWLGTSTNLAMVQYNGAALTGYKNSVQSWTQAGVISNTPVTDILVVGAMQTSGHNMTGYIFEILIFNAVLSSTQISAVNNYLNAKWAIY